MVDITNKLNASREEVNNSVNDSDNLLSGGVVFDQVLELGAQSTAVDVDANRFKVNTGSEVELLYLWEPSGTLPSAPFTVENIAINNFNGYTLTVNGADFEATNEINRSKRLKGILTGFGEDGSEISEKIEYAAQQCQSLNIPLLADGSWTQASTARFNGNLLISGLGCEVDYNGALSDTALWESTTGVLTIDAELDGSRSIKFNGGNTTDTVAAIASLEKPHRIKGVEFNDFEGFDSTRVSDSYTANGSNIIGSGYVTKCRFNNCRYGPRAYGYSEWYSMRYLGDNHSFEVSFNEINCALNAASDSLSWAINKFYNVRVVGNICRDSDGYYYDFRTNLLADGWVAGANITLTENSATITSSGDGVAYITLPDFDTAEDYNIVYDIAITSGSPVVTIVNGTTTASPVVATTRFIPNLTTFNSNVIGVRVNGAGTVEFKNIGIWKPSQVRNIVFECSNVDMNENQFIGTLRGPTMGIDCRNFSVRGNKSLGITDFGISTDTESFPTGGFNPNPQYPDANGVVSDNLVRHAGRGAWSTCRSVNYHHNTYQYCPDSVGTLRFNTTNFTEETSRVKVDNEILYGCAGTPAVACLRGKVLIGSGIVHDSTLPSAFNSDNANADSAFQFVGGASPYEDFSISGSGNQDVPAFISGFNIDGDSITGTATMVIPSSSRAKCKGWNFVVSISGDDTFGGNTVRFGFGGGAGTINGGSVLNVPSGTKIINVRCYSDSADYIASFS